MRLRGSKKEHDVMDVLSDVCNADHLVEYDFTIDLIEGCEAFIMNWE